MRFFSTETGSEYQIDTDHHRVRRLGGPRTPTRNQGPDGEWQDYIRIEPVQPMQGLPLLIVWRVDEVTAAGEDDHPGGIVRRTLTSPVRFVSEEN